MILSFIKCPCKMLCRIAALGDAGGSHNNTVLPFSPFHLPEGKLQVPPTCHTPLSYNKKSHTTPE